MPKAGRWIMYVGSVGENGGPPVTGVDLVNSPIFGQEVFGVAPVHVHIDLQGSEWWRTFSIGDRWEVMVRKLGEDDTP